MGTITKDSIIGYGVGEEIVCPECITDKEFKAIKEDDVITEATRYEEIIYFCDRCKERIEE